MPNKNILNKLKDPRSDVLTMAIQVRIPESEVEKKFKIKFKSKTRCISSQSNQMLPHPLERYIVKESYYGYHCTHKRFKVNLPKQGTTAYSHSTPSFSNLIRLFKKSNSHSTNDVRALGFLLQGNLYFYRENDPQIQHITSLNTVDLTKFWFHLPNTAFIESNQIGFTLSRKDKANLKIIPLTNEVTNSLNVNQAPVANLNNETNHAVSTTTTTTTTSSVLSLDELEETAVMKLMNMGNESPDAQAGDEGIDSPTPHNTTTTTISTSTLFSLFGRSDQADNAIDQHQKLQQSSANQSDTPLPFKV